MADKTQNVKTRLSFDGEAEYKAACKEINSTLKVLNSEMKLVTAEYKDNASSVDALKAKQAVLQKTYDEQAKKVKETEAALEKCRKATGDNSEESKKLETQLNYQKAALVKTEQELGKTTDEMEKAEKAAAEAEADSGNGDQGHSVRRGDGRAYNIVGVHHLPDLLHRGIHHITQRAFLFHVHSIHPFRLVLVFSSSYRPEATVIRESPRSCRSAAAYRSGQKTRRFPGFLSPPR